MRRHHAGVHFVEPAVQIDLSGGQPLLYAGVVAQPVDLLAHMLLDRGGDGWFLVAGQFVGQCLRQPVPYGRSAGQVLAAGLGADRAAVRVTADHDVGHAEHAHRVLDGRGLRAGRHVVLVHGHGVAGGPELEEFTGLCSGDQGRYDPGVGAGDEQGEGRLAGCETAVSLLFVAALGDTGHQAPGVLDEGLHVEVSC